MTVSRVTVSRVTVSGLSIEFFDNQAHREEKRAMVS